MANDRDYTQAAQAVASGTATPSQVELNNRMARNARFGNTLAQQAQDAQKAADKRR